MLFQAFRRHIGVGDARGAGGDRQHLVPLGSGFRCRGGFFCGLIFPGFFRELLFFRFADQVIQPIHTVHGHDPVDEIRIHEQGGEAAEHIQVHIVPGIRCGDQEEQSGRLAVQGIEFHPVGAAHKGQSRTGDGCCLGMGDGHPFAHPGAAFFFPGKDLFPVFFRIGDVPLFHHELDQFVQCFRLAAGGTVQFHTFPFQ